MKPLFDSERFSFVGSDENCIYVYCRKCRQPANVQIENSKAEATKLRAHCQACECSGTFTFANQSMTVSAP